MSISDLSRIAIAAKGFIDTFQKAIDRADVPGFDQHALQMSIYDAARDLNLALEGRTMFDPSREGPEPIGKAYSSQNEYDARIPINAIRHNLPRLLRWAGYKDPHNIGPKSGLPSLVGITDVSGNVDAEFTALKLAITDLEVIVKRTEQTPDKMPTKPEYVYVDLDGKPRNFDPAAGEVHRRGFGPDRNAILVHTTSGVWVQGLPDGTKFTMKPVPLPEGYENDQTLAFVFNQIGSLGPVQMPAGCENDLGFMTDPGRCQDFSVPPFELYRWEEISTGAAYDAFRSLPLPIPRSLRQDIQNQNRPGGGPPRTPQNENRESNPPTTDDDRPTPDEFRAYIAWKDGLSQTAIAEHLHVSQPTVHRMTKKVTDWLSKEGNSLPGLEELTDRSPRPRTYSVDPQKMDRFALDDDE